MITPALCDTVRQRANARCEFCGVSEQDYESELGVEYFQPPAHGGLADLENLLYCCTRCQTYKVDYWPTLPDVVSLWNPRTEGVATHFFEQDNGQWLPLTPVGAFTLKRLRLNRLPLVDYRARQRAGAKELTLLTRYLALMHIADSLLQQRVSLLEEQQALLQEQLSLLNLLDSHTTKEQ